MPRNKPIGTSKVSCCSVVRPISVATTLPGKLFCAACPSTRANWFDSSTISNTPVTATKVHVTSRSRYRSSRLSKVRGPRRESVNSPSTRTPRVGQALTTLRMCSSISLTGDPAGWVQLESAADAPIDKEA